MIDSSQITVVVQGPIYEIYTDRALKSIRKSLPKSEIILSTWKNSKIGQLMYDKIILSDDIGAGSIDSLGIVNNINRQLYSTQKGILQSSRKYILKYRSDMLLNTDRFLNIYEKYSNDAGIFNKRILICDYYTRNPRVIPMPYHLSDWIAFGLADDIKKYYLNIDFQSIEEDEWFKYRQNKNSFFKAILTRYAPEQYFCIKFFKQYFPIACKDYADNNKKNIFLTEKILAENFIVIDSKKNGMIFQKYSPNRYKERLSIINFSDWKRIYYKNINKHDFIYYIIKCNVKKIIYFYIRRFFSRILDFFKVKKFFRAIMK